MNNYILDEICNKCNNLSISDIMSILTFIVAIFALTIWKKERRSNLLIDTHEELLHLLSEFNRMSYIIEGLHEYYKENKTLTHEEYYNKLVNYFKNLDKLNYELTIKYVNYSIKERQIKRIDKKLFSLLEKNTNSLKDLTMAINQLHIDFLTCEQNKKGLDERLSFYFRNTMLKSFKETYINNIKNIEEKLN